MANKQSKSWRGEYQIDEITYAKSGVTVNGWQSWTLNIQTETSNKSNLDFDLKQHCYCACLHKMFEVNYLRGKYDKRSTAPLIPSINFCILLWGS